ncbi:hypothetical protein THASP1DRAFT_29045 [Thamnocephalis sphaerospora]|uniref:Uncharacterized protein n=1 Tax=Thamnocephalis sphaerospora TaxID=78915 RepID=A0A4P9XSN7_9FUNG|nr:hypothetical protein THASP1DRAFT_29045 [Thamnocephalis sphaerospora]|eukprot:RKP09165.1 hypothetical protein THASP1DRAFT_29045 [Thamnocephalis sphaerospora]
MAPAIPVRRVSVVRITTVLLAILAAFCLLGLYPSSVYADGTPASPDTVSTSQQPVLSLTLANATTIQVTSLTCIDGGCSAKNASQQLQHEVADTTQNGLMLAVNITRNQTDARCYEAVADISQLRCGSLNSQASSSTRLGLLLLSDHLIKAQSAFRYVDSPPPPPPPPTTTAQSTTHCSASASTSPCSSAATSKPAVPTPRVQSTPCKCTCSLTIADALAKLGERLRAAKCPPVRTVVVVSGPKSNAPAPLPKPALVGPNTPTTSPTPTASPAPTDQFTRQITDAIRQRNGAKDPSMDPNASVLTIADPEEAEQVHDTIAKAAGPRVFKFDIDIIDKAPEKDEEMFAAQCRIAGWVFFALILLGMLMSMLMACSLACCWQISFTVSWCDLAIAWSVSLLVAISFVLPKFVDPDLMLRLVAFVVDGLVLVSLLLRRVCTLIRFHTQCLALVLGSILITFIVGVFGGFAFQLKLTMLLRTLHAALPAWTVSLNWTLRAITITCISLFSALGIWCFHVARHLIVRPQGKHRPYKEVSIVCGVGALSMLFALLHDLLKEIPDVMAKASSSMIVCLLLYLAHTMRCWLLLLLAVWQPGSGTHHVRARLPLPMPRATRWQHVSKKQMREMEQEDREHMERTHALEQGEPESSRAQPQDNANRGRAALGTAAALAGLAALFGRKKKGKKDEPKQSPQLPASTPRGEDMAVRPPPPPQRRPPSPPLQSRLVKPVRPAGNLNSESAHVPRSSPSPQQQPPQLPPIQPQSTQPLLAAASRDNPPSSSPPAPLSPPAQQLPPPRHQSLAPPPRTNSARRAPQDDEILPASP